MASLMTSSANLNLSPLILEDIGSHICSDLNSIPHATTHNILYSCMKCTRFISRVCQSICIHPNGILTDYIMTYRVTCMKVTHDKVSTT